MKRNFYDTSSLLLRADDLFSKEENIAFSSITLQELESIKSSTSKDLDIKFAARKLLHLFIRHPNEYEVFIYNDNMNTPICKKGLELTNDTKILATAIAYDQAYPDEVIFITNDLALYNIANLFFGNDSIDMVEEDKADDYTGYLQVNMSEQEMEYFYSNMNKNIYDLLVNQYLVICDKDNNFVDSYCWTGENYRPLNYDAFNSIWFGKVKPYKNDVYQRLLFDSLYNNDMTIIRGPAGCGKSFCAMSYLMYALDKGIIDKIYIFCNPVATKDSARLGLI